MAITTLLTTADRPARRRFSWWQEALGEAFVPLECKRASGQAFFAEMRTTRINEISFSRVRGCEYQAVRAPMNVRESGREAIHLDLQLRGTCLISQDGREALIGPGDFACCDTSHPYSASMSDDFETLVISVPRAMWLERSGATGELTARVVRHDTPLGAMLSGFLRQAASVVESVVPATALHIAEMSVSLAATALGDLLCHQDPGPSRARASLLARAKFAIDHGLADPDLGSEKIARELGISRRYLQELFHEENTTVSNWIWDRRLKRCVRSLSDPFLARKSIGEIAFDSGFSSFSHFSNRFRAAYAMTPSDFRRKQLAASAEAVPKEFID